MSKSCEDKLHRNSWYTSKDNGLIRLVEHIYRVIIVYIIRINDKWSCVFLEVGDWQETNSEQGKGRSEMR